MLVHKIRVSNVQYHDDYEDIRRKKFADRKKGLEKNVSC